MKKLGFLFVLFLGLIGLISLIVFLLEPYYFNEIIANAQNAQKFDSIKNVGSIKEQKFNLGEFSIDTNNTSSYFTIPLKDLDVPLILQLLTGHISYRLYTWNTAFTSPISPWELNFIDGSTGISQQDTFNCIKIANQTQNENPNEKCKYIVVSTDKYPDLRLEVYGQSGTSISFNK